LAQIHFGAREREKEIERERKRERREREFKFVPMENDSPFDDGKRVKTH
jgi:hypothetical protein